MKVRAGRLASRCGQRDSVRWFQWGEWESRRRKCARRRRRGREDSSECAHRQRQTGAAATQHLHHTDPHLLSRRTSPRSPQSPPPPTTTTTTLSPLKCPAASAERPPPSTHFCLWSLVILSSTFRSFSYLHPSFLNISWKMAICAQPCGLFCLLAVQTVLLIFVSSPTDGTHLFPQHYT